MCIRDRFATSVKWLIMTVTRLQMESGTHSGYKLVYDATGYTMTHLLRNPLPSVKNYILFGQVNYCYFRHGKLSVTFVILSSSGATNHAADFGLAFYSCYSSL